MTSPELLNAWANLEAEQNLIAYMLTNREIVGYCVNALEPDDFYDPKLKQIFKTIKDLWGKNKPVDLISVSAEGHDMAELAELMAIPVIVHGFKNHVNIIKTLSIKRQATIAAKNIIQELNKKHFDKPNDVIQYIQGKLDLTLPKLEQTPEDMQTIAEEVIDYMEGVATGEIRPIKFGITDLDAFTGGLWNSELTIIAAGPATGKTAFALNIAHNAAKNGFKVEFFSLEMNRIQIGSRLFAQTELIQAEVMRNPQIAWEAASKELAEASEKIAKLPITIDQTSSTIQEIRNKCERKRELGQLDLVIVDYLQLLKSSARHENRRQEIEFISRELKLMSTNLNIPVVALSQLNREGQKTNKTPKLYDLRETGAIEQDADNVIFLHNPNPEETLGQNLVELEIIIAKQRSGKTGKTTLMFNKNYMKFYGMEW